MKTDCKKVYPFNQPSFAQKFSKPKSIIDELRVRGVEKPPRRVFGINLLHQMWLV